MAVEELQEEIFHPELIEFLDGDTEPVLQGLETQMAEAADALEFELAARLRDRLATVRRARLRLDRSDGLRPGPALLPADARAQAIGGTVRDNLAAGRPLAASSCAISSAISRLVCLNCSAMIAMSLLMTSRAAAER